MGNAAAGQEYGFRYDPMHFVERDETLQGAMVRALVFEQPREGDKALVQAEIDKMLGEQELEQTGKGLARLLELGIAHDRPEVKKAAQAILRQTRSQGGPEQSDKPLELGPLKALCLLGRLDEDEVQATLKWYVDNPDDWSGCPWTLALTWSTLWLGREFDGLEAAVNDSLRRATEGLNAFGCAKWDNPWGFIAAAGEIDSPAAKALIGKQLPFILRGQTPDGGWFRHGYPGFLLGSVALFRALKTHDFLEPLRELPPLPPDWKVVRSIPAPDEDLRTLTWGDGNLWVYAPQAHEAIAVSPQDGAVLERVELPGAPDKTFGIGWWDGKLALAPGRMLLVDPQSGQAGEIPLEEWQWMPTGIAQVNRKLWLAEAFHGEVCIHDPDRPQKWGRAALAAWSTYLAGADDGVWHFDALSPILAKSETVAEPVAWGHPWDRGLAVERGQAQLLDWADKPFGQDTTGIAWDGEDLWALDNGSKRICIIEKTAPTPDADD